jgi:hypothetical protein
MRALLWAAGALVALAGLQLFVLSGVTDRYFAWTINPPLTAAFLGASYWASVFFEWGAARARFWSYARISVPTVFVFTVLTLVVTLIHLDKFHFGGDFEPITRVLTWAWLAIYILVPIFMAVLWIRQSRIAGDNPPREKPVPRWMAILVGAQSVALLVMGLWLLIAPTTVPWPWDLTALTGRAIGAWLASLSIAAAQFVWEGCLMRLATAARAYTVLGLLQAVALIRYPDQFAWRSVGGWIYLVFLASILVVGLSSVSLRKRPKPSS